MPEHIRAFIVIVAIALVSFSLIKKFAINHIPLKDYKSYRTAWIISISIAFLSHNFWLASVLLLSYAWLLKRKFNDRIVIFLLLLFVAPQVKNYLSGGGLNYILFVDFVRVLSVAVLLPLFIKLIKNKNTLKFGRNKTDIFVSLFLIISVVSIARSTTFTDILRDIIYTFVDFFLPYYVVSRSIKNVTQLNLALATFFIAVLIASNIGVFESLSHWLLYNRLDTALKTPYSIGDYISRGNDLRAISSFGMPIAYGYMMTICLGLFLYLQKAVKGKFQKILILMMILVGLYAPVSRGPWVGALCLYLCFIVLNKQSILELVKLSYAASILILILLVSPYKDKVINLIPFIGKTEHHNVEYRQKLFKVSTTIIARHPIIGSTNYLDEPEMTELYQGDVSNSDLKVDIVNTYILIALKSGFLGLGVFILMFLSTLVTLLKSISKIKLKSNSLFVLGASLISILVSMMLMIGTVSPIMTIPIVNFMFLGFSVAYIRIIKDYIDDKV